MQNMPGFEADRLIEVIQGGPQASELRIIFEQNGHPFFFQFKRDEMRAMMPLLAKATNPKGPEVTTIVTTDVAASMDMAGGFLLTLVNTAGAEMTFELSQALTVKLSALADEALQTQGGSAAKH